METAYMIVKTFIAGSVVAVVNAASPDTGRYICEDVLQMEYVRADDLSPVPDDCIRRG